MTESETVELQNPEFMLKLAKRRFNGLQAIIFGEISAMLKTSKLLPLYELQNQNPTFKDIVAALTTYRDIATQVATMLGSAIDQSEIDDVNEYLELASELAEAIDSDNHDSLCAAIAALDDKPYI
ncbi:hypothetical protein NVI2019_PEGOAJLN_00682 [Providencia alcalifaciens]|uniref:hypothetical protein n=1 Tax=Providencia alcalifaciens TaxID=126385 RepID=UPI001CC80C99|nr:hypothetical protein [Providencia alcalifaciens]CAG9411147.1 hypothetical protein NVI2019_PEGOAJLN_00682 [Providencia alcalifaciens]